METEIKAHTAQPSLLLLNEYCLMDIFEFLDIDDSISLAKTCNRLRFIADRIFKKHSKFRLQSRMVNKGEQYIDSLFQYIGQYVTSLHFASDTAHRNLNKILYKITNNCKNLKNIKLSIILCVQGVQPVYCFDNVEQLTLYYCHGTIGNNFTKHLVKSFHRLKTVNIGISFIGWDELKTVFQNNRSIESFVFAWSDRDFNCQLLELIPNVECLCLLDNLSLAGDVLELDSLLKLNRLTKLRLDCTFKNINSFLRKLSTREIIEEMHLDRASIDDDFFDILPLFSKLHSLVLDATKRNVQLKSSIVWPNKLKKLRLLDFQLTQNDLIAMIQQLKSIESIDISECTVPKDDITNFNDVEKFSQDIHHIISHSNRKQRLGVVLPYCVNPAGADPSKKYLIESERLRILHHFEKFNPLGIKIHFDGCDFL